MGFFKIIDVMNIRTLFILLCIFSFTVYAQNSRGKFQQFRQNKHQNFQNFKKEKHDKFDEFRRKINEDFASFMEHSGWEIYDKAPAEDRPVEKDVAPVVYDEKNHQGQKDREQQVRIVSFDEGNFKPQPKPIVPINENSETQGYSSFTYYGTNLQVRWGDLTLFKIGGKSDKSLADAFRKLTDIKYNNLLSDCLQIREKYSLCDWAYYKMLEALSAAACGKNTDEATFLQGVLFQQSGYTVRFARDAGTKKLCLLVKTDGVVYDYTQTVIKGAYFYLFKDSRGQKLDVCNIEYSGEQDMQMTINQLPRLENKYSETRNINSMSYNIKVSSYVNKNLLDFMNDFPSSYDGNNVMTRWAYYANTPISEDVKQRLYPQLQERLKNTNELMAVNMLLNWVQTGFEYELDDKVWGRDRAFFAEETLFYPFSDCEDRAILFSHLVRDLLGLDVVLVHYPGHLATAVCFSNSVEGDYLLLDKRKFTIADPTYERARVGKTMPKMNNKIAEIILCKR
jgi:hypothetical protein